MVCAKAVTTAVVTAATKVSMTVDLTDRSRVDSRAAASVPRTAEMTVRWTADSTVDYLD